MTERDTQTDASDLIICPMLCYSNGTDNEIKLHLLLSSQNKDQTVAELAIDK